MSPVPVRWLASGSHLVNALLLAGTLVAAERALTQPTRATVRPAPAAAAPRPEPAPPAVSTAVIVERGLFGRAEAEAPAPAPGPREASPAPPLPPVPALIGTVVQGRGRGSAVFAGADGRQELVAQGEPIDGEWRLVAVRRGAAVVEHRSGRRDTVPLPLSALD